MTSWHLGAAIAVGLTLGASACATDCRPMVGDGMPVVYAEARFSIPSCCLGTEHLWNGHRCVPAPAGMCGCSCEGTDCKRVFPSREGCEAAYQRCAQE